MLRELMRRAVWLLSAVHSSKEVRRACSCYHSKNDGVASLRAAGAGGSSGAGTSGGGSAGGTGGGGGGVARDVDMTDHQRGGLQQIEENEERMVAISNSDTAHN